MSTKSDASPAILLHSGGMSSRQWRRLAERLAPSRRVIAPDFLGCGENPLWPDDAPFELSMDVDRIAAFVADVGAAHLVGHSYGGLVALQVARRHPQKIRSLAVYDPVAFGVLHAAGDAIGLADLERVGQNPVFTDRVLGGSDPWFEAFIDYWNGPGSWRALPPPSRDAFLRVGRKVFYEVLSLMHDRTPADAYARFEGPALLLTGDASPVAAHRVVALLAAKLPRAESVTVPGAGHMGPLTHLAVVNERIAEHIAAA